MADRAPQFSLDDQTFSRRDACAMTRETLDISVIICAYTEARWHDIVDAVASLHQQDQLPREVIIVCDHNPALFRRLQNEIAGVIVIENTESQGLSGARNSGVAVAQGSFVAFLDDDATAEPDWLSHLHRCLQDPNVIGVGGTVEPEWLSTPPAWFPSEFYWVVGCTYRGLPETRVVVRNPYGGCTCYRKEIFDVSGGFRSEIGRIGTRPLGCEETELCIRVKQHWPRRFFLYEPKARIHHRVPASRVTWRYFRSRCYAEGLSKAMVTRFVGSKDGLAAERSYTLHTLPLGVLRGIRDGVLHRNAQGYLRAAAIILGLFITTIGYLVGKVATRNISPSQSKLEEQKVSAASQQFDSAFPVETKGEYSEINALSLAENE
jgi:glucosyl-dolichyl phosphate glucuronosyltransferase